MYGYTCNVCGCNCDAGELENGVCDDCREEEEEHEIRKEWTRKMLSRFISQQSDGQLVMFHGAG